MRNILVTNFDNSGDDVMIFTNKETAESVRNKLDKQNLSFDDIIEVPDNECQYYVYEPCWLKD